jgi:hypothetical protein
MDKQVKAVIEKYQCVGCVCGGDISCYEPRELGVGCGEHCAGTVISGIGRVFLGLPKGFNRLGEQEKFIPFVFESHEQQESEFPYDSLNVPVWKHKDDAVVIVRGYQPRVNTGFIHIIMNGDMGRINCIEMTDADLGGID